MQKVMRLPLVRRHGGAGRQGRGDMETDLAARFFQVLSHATLVPRFRSSHPSDITPRANIETRATPDSTHVMTRNTQAASNATPADAVPANLVDHLPARLKPYARLARLDRPIGTWLLFWPCVFGLILGAAADERRFLDWRDAWYVILFAVGALVMRGAGCTFNDIIDRDFDAQVARTRGRPIPSGTVSVKQAAAFLVAQCLAGLAILLQFNWFAVALGAASLLLVAAYPFMKRITWWPQAWLGLTFNWGAILGFAAQTGRIDLGDAMLYAGLLFWTLGYDTIYAHQDKEDDALIGVKST